MLFTLAWHQTQLEVLTPIMKGRRHKLMSLETRKLRHPYPSFCAFLLTRGALCRLNLLFVLLSSSDALVATERLWTTARLFMPNVRVTMTPCGIPPALLARSVATPWWTWCTSGPIRSYSADGTTASRSGRDAPAATRWEVVHFEPFSPSRSQIAL